MIKSINEINLESLVAELKLEPSPFKINSTPMTNLLCSNHNHLFIYIEQLGSFLTLTTKIAGNKNESTLINSTSSSTIQVKQCINIHTICPIILYPIQK